MQPTAKGLLPMHVHPAFPVACALVEALGRVLPRLRAADPALARALCTAAVAIPRALASARRARPGPRAIRHLHRAYLQAMEARRLLLDAEARRHLPSDRPNAATVLAGQLVQLVAPTV
jgi:hypothetical protein